MNAPPVRLEDAQLDERSDVLDGRPGTGGNLLLGQAVGLSGACGNIGEEGGIGYEPVMARLRAEVVRLSFVLGGRRGIVGVHPHPADGVRRHGHLNPPGAWAAVLGGEAKQDANQLSLDEGIDGVRANLNRFEARAWLLGCRR